MLAVNVTVVVARSGQTDMVAESLRSVRAGLSAHQTDVIDLDADGFDPFMSADERAAYFTDDPVRDPLVARYGEMVNRADALVFVYHSTWCGLPSITKGWLEKVMVPGVAFGFDAQGTIEPRLRHVRRLAGVVTYDDTHAQLRRTTDGGRRTVLRALRASTGLRTRASWYGLYALPRTSGSQREQFLARVSQGFSRW